MKGILKNIIVTFIVVIIINMTNIKETYGLEYNEDELIKVGYYTYKPYFYIDKDYKVTGYYNDILNLICNDLNIEFEYVEDSFSGCIEKLKNGEIDMLIGIHYSEERSEKLRYTNNYVTVEKYGIYTNENINYGDLDSLNEMKFALIEDEKNSQWINSIFKKNDIDIRANYVKSHEEAKRKLISGEVDAIISTLGDSDLEEYKKIYEYSTGPVYIVGNKNSEYIIREIDSIIDSYGAVNKNPMKTIYNKYFHDSGEDIRLALILTVILTVLMIIFKCLYGILKRRHLSNKIKYKIKYNKFHVYYQPIVNPRSKNIIGFEGLLRLQHPTKGILPPSCFLKDIEESNMMPEVTLWVIERVIDDYQKIASYSNMQNQDFYISINLSLNEIENEKFINQLKEVIVRKNVQPNMLCLEILESVSINCLSKIQHTIVDLKSYGIKIAIDDFGVKYSNLDILEKFDFDIIKLDKYFIDSIADSVVSKEILEFISNVAMATNKSLVLEGIEQQQQLSIIAHTDNTKLYVQGYYYSKPMPLEKIEEIHIQK